MTRTHKQQVADFAQWLEEQQACGAAQRWARGKTLQEAWEQCPACYLVSPDEPNREWLTWLLWRIWDEGTLTRREWSKLWLSIDNASSRRGLLDDIEFIDVEPV